MQVLITGAAGFIGFHLACRLLQDGLQVYGIDNLNDYYDVQLKRDRLAQLEGKPGFAFQELDLCDRAGLDGLFAAQQFDLVFNLAAQAGVRYSLENPWSYVDSNINGFLNVLECCRHHLPRHLIYASSSSVYGTNRKVPFSTSDRADGPVSLYAASKRANELMAHAYSHLYGIPSTGLRFFTVYGPWGRPDMAYFKFVRAIEAGKTIDIYNHGRMERDFTYIDDVIEGLARVGQNPPQPGTDSDTGAKVVPHRLYNIGNNSPVTLMEFVETIERALGKTAEKNFLPMQPGDVPATYADVDNLMQDVGFKPSTTLAEGLDRFVRWYREYYGASPTA